MKNKPFIGQTLFKLNVGNAARHIPQVLTPVKVTKVGSKYFTIGEGWEAKQYHLDDWSEKTEYSAESNLYLSEQEYLDEQEEIEICREISRAFDKGKNSKFLPLSRLREIKDIIDF